MLRPFCKACNKNHAANNYIKDGVRHYRSRCDYCIKRDRNVKQQPPRWQINGYKKKATCDICGFHSKYSSQITVFHIDGNLNNSELINLRSICLCCIEVVKRRNSTWRVGDIEPDR